MQAHFRPELTGSAPKTFGECGRYFTGCIEGSIPFLGLSDLKSRNSERFDARLHGAGINDEENAGRYSKLMSGMDWEFSVAATSWSGDSMAYWPVSAPSNTAPHYYRNHGNPYLGEKARLRSQQIFFGGGETCMQMRKLIDLWGDQ